MYDHAALQHSIPENMVKHGCFRAKASFTFSSPNNIAARKSKLSAHFLRFFVKGKLAANPMGIWAFCLVIHLISYEMFLAGRLIIFISEIFLSMVITMTGTNVFSCVILTINQSISIYISIYIYLYVRLCATCGDVLAKLWPMDVCG